MHFGKSAFFIRLGGCNVGCAWCDTKEEAAARLNHLEIATDYHNYATKQEEGVYPERSRIMEELYNKSGRTNSIFTGLAEEYVEVSNNNSK